MSKATENPRLGGSGWTVPPNIDPVAKFNLDDRGYISSLSGPDGNILKLSKPSGSLKSSWMGRMQSVATGGANHTSTYYRTLECHTDRIRVWVFNPVAAILTNCKVLLSTSDTMPGLNTSLAGSTTTPGGIISGGASVASAQFDVAAGTDANAISATPSPWIDISTIDRVDVPGALPLLRVRVELPGASNANRPALLTSNTRAAWENPANIPGGRVMKCRSDAVLGATTGGSGASTAFADDVMPILIEYMPRTGYGTTFCILGDSLPEGVDVEIEGYGWPQISRAAVSSMESPVEICMLAAGSTNSTDHMNRAESVLPLIKPEVVIAAMFTPNGITAPTFTETGNARLMYRNTQRIKAVCADNNLRYVGWSGVPMLSAAPDPSTGYKDMDSASATALNAYIAAILASRDPVIDSYSALIGGHDVDGQATLRVGSAAGNLHLTLAGQTIAAEPATRMMRNILAS